MNYHLIKNKLYLLSYYFIGDMMLKRKAIRKITITTITVCLLLMIYLMPGDIKKENVLQTNVEVENVENMSKCKVYLLNDDDLLVRANIAVFGEATLEEKIKNIINNLMKTSNELIPNGLNAIIPKNTKVLGIQIDEGIVNINFSKEMLDIEEHLEERMTEAIAFSLLELDDITGVSIYVEGKNISELLNSKIPSIITKDWGINKRYDINNKKNVKKFVVYYIDEIEDKKYYVPITKYVNDDRDKIKIIIDNLSSNYIYQPNLVSFLNQNTELINYEIDNDIMTLNFNNSIFMSDGQILEEVVYSIMYSVFDNYNVEEVILKVDNEEIVKKTIKELE